MACFLHEIPTALHMLPDYKEGVVYRKTLLYDIVKTKFRSLLHCTFSNLVKTSWILETQVEVKEEHFSFHLTLQINLVPRAFPLKNGWGAQPII